MKLDTFEDHDSKRYVLEFSREDLMAIGQSVDEEDSRLLAAFEPPGISGKLRVLATFAQIIEDKTDKSLSSEMSVRAWLALLFGRIMCATFGHRMKKIVKGGVSFLKCVRCDRPLTLEEVVTIQEK